MANSMDQSFIRGYNNSVIELVEVLGRAFGGKTDERSQIGELEFYETLGSVYAQSSDSGGDFGNYAETPIMDAEHAKRVCAQVDADIGMTINKLDEVKALVTFQSRYIKRMAQALNRKRDIQIIKGALGTATTGKLADGTALFDYTNQTVSGGTLGMSVDKLKEIRANFLKAGYNPYDEMFVALTGKQLADLQSDEEFTSFDYNNEKPLTTGEVGMFLGITIVHSELLPFTDTDGKAELVWDATDRAVDTDTTTTRACFAWIKEGIIVGTNPDITTEVDKDPFHKFNWVAYASQGVGAVRTQESAVQLVPCKEA